MQVYLCILVIGTLQATHRHAVMITAEVKAVCTADAAVGEQMYHEHSLGYHAMEAHIAIHQSHDCSSHSRSQPHVANVYVHGDAVCHVYSSRESLLAHQTSVQHKCNVTIPAAPLSGVQHSMLDSNQVC